MKKYTPTIVFTASLLMPLMGIEPPRKPRPIPPSDSREVVELPSLPKSPEQAPAPNAQRPAPASQPAVAFAGVSLTELPMELARHLGIEANQGALVKLVAPDSPAQKAGIQNFDILQTVDGTPLRGHECLCNVLKKHQPGDEVEVTLTRRGEKLSQKMTLGERPQGLAAEQMIDNADPAAQFFRNIPEQFAPEVRKLLEDNLRELNRMNPNGLSHLQMLDVEKLRQQAEETMERMMQQHPQMDNMNLNQKMLDMMNGSPQNLTMSMQSRISMVDENGRIEIIRGAEKEEARIYDSSGNLEWSGPFSSEEDKNKMPENVRSRIEKLNIKKGSGSSFELQLQRSK